MNVNTPTAAPMAFFVPSHNAVYDRATQLEGQWVTQREAKRWNPCAVSIRMRS
jgi:hypothetical protein